MESVSDYRNRLDGYDRSKRTKELYLYYFKSLKSKIGDLDVTEEIAIAFLKDYPNSVCMAFLNDYIKWKRLDIKLEDKIVKRKPKSVKRYISPEEIKKLGRWLKKHYGFKYQLMLYLAYNCALRRKETIGFNINYLKNDFRGWEEGTPLRITITKESAKGEKERKIVIKPIIAKALKNYIINNKEKIISTTHPNNVFRIGATRWHEVFKDGVHKALNRDYTLHELRFSKATYWWQKKGFDIVTIQKLLGHVDIKTTQRYIDPSQEVALRKLEEIYNE